MFGRALVGVVILAAVAFPWGSPSRCELMAAEHPNAPRAVPDQLPAPPAQSNVGSPAVFLARGGPERTGAVSGSHLPEHPAVQWTTPIPRLPGQPLLADGVVYVGDVTGTLFAIKLSDGSVIWSHNCGSQIFSSPVKRGETIYFTSRNGLTALAQEDGTPRWNCTLVANATESSPLIVNDRIVVADLSGKVSAVDFDGKLIWQHDIAADAPESPPRADGLQPRFPGTAARPGTAASDGTAIYQPIFDQSRIAVIDLKAGRRRWSFEMKGWIWGAPVVADGKLFFGCQDNHLYCLDKTRKTLLWSFPTKSRIEAGAGYRDGSVYFGSCDGRFYRLNAETGKEVWSYQTPIAEGSRTAIYSAPFCTEDAVYFGSFDSFLYCLRCDDGKLKWRLQPVPGAEIDSAPQTDGRRIVVAVHASLDKRGQNAIVAIGEDERKK
jgi:outer membrane protein assembly factor BamB